MFLQPDDVLKILLAVAAGGLIGIEREFRDKAAGFRTLIFICAGSCLFTMLSIRFAPDTDPNRIAANIVTGVGFLGAGVILRDGGKVIGLTTAATIWLTAAVGMGLGGGQYLLSGLVVLVAMVVLWILPWVEHRIDNMTEARSYEVICPAKFDMLENLEHTFRSAGLRVQIQSQVKHGERMTTIWHVRGSPEKHLRLERQLLENTDVEEFRY